jgi:hypothetical protein
MIEAAKFKPEARPLFRTVDMNAFSGESIADYEHIPGDGVKAVSSAVPPSFPPHLTVNGVVELGGYLASASYIVSLGGPPLPDLKYGIIVVPTGEEDLLFSGYGDHAGMSAEFKEQIYVRSKEAQKEQVMELRQKALEELANGVSCDPEPDDDDREFYRRRWLARKGINVDEEDTPAGDVVAGGSDAPLHDAGSPQVAVDPLASLGDEQSRQSVRHSNDGDLKQDTASTRQGDTAASADNHVAAGTKTDIIHINGEIPRDDDGHDSQHNGETEPGTKTDLPINWDVHRDDEGHDPQLNGETEPGTNGHMPINREVPRDDDGHDPQLNGEMERAPSTPDTLRSTVGGVSPISHDGCRALEALLRGGKKRRSSRRVLNSLLSNTKLRSTQTPVLAHRDVLLEVATAITRMANGDLSTNPGIDHRLWEAVRKDLAVKPAPS